MVCLKAQNKQKERTGFTLIKLLLVIFIIAVWICPADAGKAVKDYPETHTILGEKDKEQWVFVGAGPWTKNEEGIIYPPMWSNRELDPDPKSIAPNFYEDDLTREDYAFAVSEVLDDTDISVDYKSFSAPVSHGGIIFRADDNQKFCVLDINDMGRKGQYYELTLWLQDQNGYRSKLASGKAAHSIVPDHIVQTGPKSREDWENSSPDWFSVRVQVTGTYIRVSVDGQIVFDVRERSIPQRGCIGLVGRGPVYFRKLKVGGKSVKMDKPLDIYKKKQKPRFFYPGGEQHPEGFNAFPAACRTRDGAALVAWSHASLEDNKNHQRQWPHKVLFSRSDDDCKSWGEVKQIDDFGKAKRASVISLFGHLDGSISCIANSSPVTTEDEKGKTLVFRSRDGGMSWSSGEELKVGGRILRSEEYLYSPMQRLSDGKVVMCGYEAKINVKGLIESNANRLDRSLLFFSDDDGFTWNEPVYFDTENFDHNECMVAETENGKLVAFMRTLSAPYMWTSRSEDGGMTWSKLVQSNVSAECPCLLRHSSGAIILASRGSGTFVQVSLDNGKSWTEQTRIDPTSGMMNMVEMPDGKILIVMHEGYHTPSHIRCLLFKINGDKIISAD